MRSYGKKLLNLRNFVGVLITKYPFLVNPVMMVPTTVKLYITQVDEIAKEFIKR